jgi:integration host factor subunit beta
MLKSELIERVAERNPHLYQRDAEKIVNAILDAITAALEQGDRVELRDFGVFRVKTRTARTGRNPRTGGAVPVDEKVVPTFKTARNMHRRLNPSSDKSVASRPPARGRTSTPRGKIAP